MSRITRIAAVTTIATAGLASSALAAPTAKISTNAQKLFNVPTYVALAGDQVTFSGAGSTGGKIGNFPLAISSYSFDFEGDGTNDSSGINAQKSYAAAGTYAPTLTVKNTFGQTAKAKLELKIHTAPKPAFSSDPTTPTAGATVKLDASASTDDGSITKYEWDLDGDNVYELSTQNAKLPTTFDTPGARMVGLQVTDNYGVKAEVKKQIDVAAPDTTAPVVTISPDADLSGRTFTVSVGCPATEAKCMGELTLAKVGKARFSVGEFAVPGGSAQAVQIKVNKAGRKRIKKAGALTTTATAVAEDASGNEGTATGSVTISR